MKLEFKHFYPNAFVILVILVQPFMLSVFTQMWQQPVLLWEEITQAALIIYFWLLTCQRGSFHLNINCLVACCRFIVWEFFLFCHFLEGNLMWQSSTLFLVTVHLRFRPETSVQIRDRCSNFPNPFLQRLRHHLLARSQEKRKSGTIVHVAVICDQM